MTAQMSILTEHGLEYVPVEVLCQSDRITLLELLADVPLLDLQAGVTKCVPNWLIE